MGGLAHEHLRMRDSPGFSLPRGDDGPSRRFSYHSLAISEIKQLVVLMLI